MNANLLTAANYAVAAGVGVGAAALASKVAPDSIAPDTDGERNAWMVAGGVGGAVTAMQVLPRVAPSQLDKAVKEVHAFDKRVLADGFKAYLQFIPTFRESLLRLAAGTKVLATTRSYISSIDLVLPSADEQRAIASVLTDADAEIAALQRRLESSRAVKQGMMQELLTGRARLVLEVAA